MTGSLVPCDGNEKYIFVSYTAADRARIMPILEFLRDAGFKLWWESGITLDPSEEQLTERIRSCAVFMTFISERSLQSRYCNAEIMTAVKWKKNILTVLLEDIRLDAGMQLMLSNYASLELYRFPSLDAFCDRLVSLDILRECNNEKPDVAESNGRIKCSFEPYEGSEKYIFISYAHEDIDRVAPVLEKLNEAGFRIWYDEGIEWGTEWPEEIAKHISGCCVCMPFHSKKSAISQNCRNEINYALKLNKTILSVYLEDVKLSKGMDMQLSSFQSTFPYQYDGMSEFYERLIRSEVIRECRGSGRATDTAQRVIPETQSKRKNEARATVLKLLGEWGDNAVSLYEESTQTLYIKGKGAMWWYAPDGNAALHFKSFIRKDRPWDGYSVKTVSISEGIEDIGVGAFCNMTLEGVSIPNSVTMIARRAFAHCRFLKAVTVPENVEIIAEDAFEGCTSLKEIRFLGTASQWNDLGLTPEDINHATVTFAK